MKPTQPHITPARVEAFAASALRVLGWLLGVILRVGARGRSARLRHLLSHAEHAVECILFLKAVVQHGPPPQRRNRPPSTPRGFRRIAARRHPLFSKGAKVRAGKHAGSLARVLALINALANPERAVAHFFRRLCSGLRGSRLVAASPLDEVLTAAALDAAPGARLDSS